MMTISSNNKALDKLFEIDTPISIRSYESCNWFCNRDREGTKLKANDFLSQKKIKAEIRQIVDKNDLLYDHAQFNDIIEVVIKMLDRLDRFDGIFVQ